MKPKSSARRDSVFYRAACLCDETGCSAEKALARSGITKSELALWLNTFVPTGETFRKKNDRIIGLLLCLAIADWNHAFAEACWNGIYREMAENEKRLKAFFEASDRAEEKRMKRFLRHK